MNILLLGNGYDLNYKLPTSYHNFLLTIAFLSKCNLEKVHTVGDVFGNSSLQKEDKFIAESYKVYKEVYDDVKLDAKVLRDIVERAKRNMWFSYFLNCLNREAGWIDVEREIAFVVSRFQSFFDKAGVRFSPVVACNEIGSKYIIMNMFNFFVDALHSRSALITEAIDIKPEYTAEYPKGSGECVIDKEKIIRELSEALIEFADILKAYLQYFIDKTVGKLVERSAITQLQALIHTDVVITFNYTNTYEYFDSTAQIFHIHGNVNDKIVLGVNPDKSDEIETIDTAFLAFKKYYQRTEYDTDMDYLNWLRSLGKRAGFGFVHLLVMGHSLDVTDADIIRELFGLAFEITVIYHSESAKSNHIRNLVNIFGKEKFDQIRNEQRLMFLSLNTDFSTFSNKMEQNSSILQKAKFL